jgi:hypothetical protein
MFDHFLGAMVSFFIGIYFLVFFRQFFYLFFCVGTQIWVTTHIDHHFHALLIEMFFFTSTITHGNIIYIKVRFHKSMSQFPTHHNSL